MSPNLNQFIFFMKNTEYQPLAIEVIEVQLEQGFAVSGGDGTIGNGFGDGGYIL